MLKDLIDIKSLTNDNINLIIKTAQDFKSGLLQADLKSTIVALMFYENSTRTRCSFEIAAKRLNMITTIFDTKSSSLSKGESLEDTIENLTALGVEVIVLRHNENNIINTIKRKIKADIKFVNAGTGSHSHPTQALLDYFTMLEKLGTVKNKKITIVGDIKDSRVAKSNIALLSRFGADIHIAGPKYFMPEKADFEGVTFHKNLIDAIIDSDIVMTLRIQKERLEADFGLDIEDYKKDFQINKKILAQYAPNSILMHPGPVNRGIELTSNLIDSEKGKTILEQAQNGVFIRMAILNLIANSKKQEAIYAS
ncbi:MAG: aspartate carbamoyltransferase catalytic subunit [Candidatus Gastranaerophilales bacterium]|nr:aspartate carbamoyltransferase catalytic subunit [Candidatus Gastranaerophilales bacterium]